MGWPRAVCHGLKQHEDFRLLGGFLGWHHEVLCGGLCAAGGPVSQPPEEVTGVGSVRGLPGINYHLHRACWAQLP